jgi:hypothetical protein
MAVTAPPQLAAAPATPPRRDPPAFRAGDGLPERVRLPAGQVIARPAQRGQYTVSQIHVECGQEGVQVVRHKTIFDALRLTFRAAVCAKI